LKIIATQKRVFHFGENENENEKAKSQLKRKIIILPVTGTLLFFYGSQ
jgi:hypothetical protein